MGLIQISVPTLSSPMDLESCVTHLLLQEHIQPDDIFLIVNSDRVRSMAQQLVEEKGVLAHYSGTNQGTCASWNFGNRTAWDRGYRTNLLLNDDVQVVERDGLHRLGEAALANPKSLYFCSGLGFSGVAITREIWEEVGLFDEGFWPAYYEDNDYHRRAVLAGYGSIEISMQSVHAGSHSLREWPEWEQWNAHWAFMTNARRFVEKWGGLPENPTYDKPWKGDPGRAWDAKDWLRAHAPVPPWASSWAEIP